jgi:cytochrome P450
VTSQHPTPQHRAVSDWASDFDHTDPQWVADPYPIWDDLRSRCPVAHSDRYGGTWLPLRHEDVSAVAYDTEHFTSRSVVVSEVRPGPNDLPAPIGLAPPITSDPPFHALARRLLLPAFSPKRIKTWSRSPASCASSCSTPPQAVRKSMPPSTTPSTSRCG